VGGNGTRAVVTAAIALVVLTGGSLLWIACEPADQAGPSATPEPQATALPDGWVRCMNAEVGFSIGYPADWFRPWMAASIRIPRSPARTSTRGRS
jgi:hypothetical protein